MSPLAAFLAFLAHLTHAQLVGFLDLVWNALHPGAHGVPRLVTCDPTRGCRTFLDWYGRRIAA